MSRRTFLLGWLIDALSLLEFNLPVKGLLQLVILQFQLTLQVYHIHRFCWEKAQQIGTEYELLMQILVKHADNLRDIAVPFNQAPDLAPELIPLIGGLLVVPVCHRLQDAGHSSHGSGILPPCFEILLGKSLNIYIRVDPIAPQFSLCLVNQVGIDLLLEHCLLVERLESLQDVLLCIHKIQHKGIVFAWTGAVQPG